MNLLAQLSLAISNLAQSMPSMANMGNYILLALGLGFVIFFHELGHFLAAKYCGVPVEQFAIGFGPAIVAWRKGLGLRRGTTTPEAENRVMAYLESKGLAQSDTLITPVQRSKAMAELGLDETEYRLNWVFLGGYVKMLGQDDMDPNNISSDPRAYNNKPIRSRMLIISAGVLMNVLLAAIGFMIVFLMGFRSAPAEVGAVMADSPATYATAADGSRHPLAVGDRIVSFDGSAMHDFAKIALGVALVKEGRAVPLIVQHPDGQEETLTVTPARAEGDRQGLLSLGVIGPQELRGPDLTEKLDADLYNPKLDPADFQAIKPGDTITAINGAPVSVDEIWKLDQALAASDGHDIALTVTGADGAIRHASVQPHFQVPFGTGELSLAGMRPRARVDGVRSDSPVVGKLLPGDVILEITQPDAGKSFANPSNSVLREAINAAGQQGKPVSLSVLGSDGTTRTIEPIVPGVVLPDDRRGLAIQLGLDEQSTVVASVAEGSAAAKAGIQPGWRITRVGDAPVSNWFQVRAALALAKPEQPLAVQAQAPAGDMTVNLSPSEADIDSMKFQTFACDLLLHEHTELRKTTNPLIAAQWGISETRDFILQFYVTLRRMFAGSVSYKQAMGPVGIVRFGAMSASRGTDWLVWFLAMISANLAVANFLPIPIMDGGVFALLILEAVQGRPLSARTQQVMQMVGLAIIVSLFLLITYQDITRPFGHG